MFFENQFNDFFSRFSAGSDSYSLRKMNVVKTLIQVVLFFFQEKASKDYMCSDTY